MSYAEGLCSSYSLFVEVSQGMANRLESQVLAVQEPSDGCTERLVLMATNGDDVPEYRNLSIGHTSTMCRIHV
jgi:hypothetical protein